MNDPLGTTAAPATLDASALNVTATPQAGAGSADALGTAAPLVASIDVGTGNPPTDAENVYSFKLPDSDIEIHVDLAAIPAATRMDMLKKEIRRYVTNSTNQVVQKHNKKLEPYNAYDNAVKADPLQTAVAKPADPRPADPDLLEPAFAARKRLYEGAVQKKSGEGSKRETRDPLTKMVTDAVVRELFDKRKAAGANPKWTDVTAEVGSDGIAYLDKLIADKVALGGDAQALAKFKEERYIKPVKMALGMIDNKATKDMSLL